MRRGAPLAAAVVTALMLGGLTVGVSAQAPAETTVEEETGPATESHTGTVVAIPTAEGRTVYYLELEDGTLIKLSFGPVWFWGPQNPSPLDAIVGQPVTIGGHLRDGEPDEHASETARENASRDPVIKVTSIDGSPMRPEGKPQWAGGPKVLGQVHPGFEGWSRGQAEKADKAARPAQAVKPTKARGATGRAAAPGQNKP